MNLIKNEWTKNDVDEFQEYLRSLSRPEKENWTKNILNTKMPVLAILSPEIKRIAKEIYKGNFLSFLDFWLWDYYDNTTINGLLISKIKDFEIYKKYITKYSQKVDNWASCDILTFNVDEKNKNAYFSLAKEFIYDAKPFVRRIGFDIFFKFINDKTYLLEIFKLLNDFEFETEYYVNMVIAWFIAECFTKNREQTILFLKNNNLNKFCINKAIQKCRDSFRISNEDKEILLKFKK